MYKTLTFEELIQIRTSFFSNLKKIYEKEGYTYFKQFLKKANDWITKELLYFSGSEVYFRIIFNEEFIEIVDEKQALKLRLNEEDIWKVHNFLKKKIDNTWKKNIANTLLEKFSSENMKKYLGKHFLVYDIETIGNIQNLKETKFMIWYVIDSKDFEKTGQPPKYKYVNQANLDKFVEYLVNYDGYIIWYNNIAFDNPVVVYNSSFENKEELIKKINEKSLDLFYVYSKIFWKRVWLNQVATNIVWVSKTLSSWEEGAHLLKIYDETNDKKALEKVKNYCKNDVKMTLAILLYLIFNWKINYQWKEINLSCEDILKLWQEEKKEEKKVSWLLDLNGEKKLL